jgi:hypothetical protein
MALVKPDVSEERITSIIRVKGINRLGTLMLEAIRYSKTSVLAKATLRNIPEDGILHSPRRKDLRSYIIVVMFSPV